MPGTSFKNAQGNGYVEADGFIVTGGATITNVLNTFKYSSVLSPASVAANITAEQTFTVTGLLVGDVVTYPNKPTAQAGLGIVGVRVSATNTLAITFANNTAAPIVPTASEAYTFVASR